jgi:hypothetical protein
MELKWRVGDLMETWSIVQESPEGDLSNREPSKANEPLWRAVVN